MVREDFPVPLSPIQTSFAMKSHDGDAIIFGGEGMFLRVALDQGSE
jgi:hypothetical protein